MKKIFLISVMFSLMLVGCGGGKQTVTRFYLLEYPSEQAAASYTPEHTAPFPYACNVSPVDIHPAFASHQIAIREHANQINYFSFNEWATRPTESLTRLVLQYFQNNEVFETVISLRSGLGSVFSVETHVSRMDLTIEQKAFTANLAVKFSLVHNETRQVITSYQKVNQRLLEDKSLNEFAAAISEMFVEGLVLFTNQITLQDLAE
jgi:ABC-type uncharacterized transport system auxiliary subunit